jgi:succinate dehydrogenase/fumarate reductase-like Fe-S protein
MSKLDWRVSVIDHLIYEKPCRPALCGSTGQPIVTPSTLAAIRAAAAKPRGA